MKKKLFLLCTMLIALFPAQSIMAQSDETECISVEQDGSMTLRVWGKGRNRLDAVEQAKKNAVYDVLFKGNIKGSKGYYLRPIITEVNARERYQEYFDIFFLDDGEYLKYISMADRRIGSTKRKVKGSEQVMYCVTVRVLVPELRQRLTQDGVLKTE